MAFQIFISCTVTEFEMGFQKFMPQIIFYRIYKIFGNGKFQVNIKICRFDKNDINNFKGQSFQYAPIIKKYI